MAKILIVDDSETFLHRLEADLIACGHVVVKAVNGQLGNDIVESDSNIELVITDLNMPIRDGLTMAELINRDRKPRLPIIILSTMVNEELKTRGKAAGVRVWIIKPYSAKMLCQAIDLIVPARASSSGK